MDIAHLDYFASTGDTIMHKASVPSKILLAAVIVGASIGARDVRAAAAVFCLAVALNLLSRIPVLRMWHMFAYPAFFGAVFSAVRPALGLIRSVSAAAGLVLLLATTPFPALHAVLSRIMPGVLADSLYMTYRSLFLLAGQVAVFGRVLRLRGARNVPAVGSALGAVLLRSIDLSERTGRVLAIRGYSTGIAMRGSALMLTGYDWYPVLASLLVIAVRTVL